MKQGIAIDDYLPNEILGEVVNFLPAYSFVGSNAKHSVSRKWNAIMSLKPKMTFEEVIESCKEPEDALAILNDKKLFYQLSYDQFIFVVGTHPDLADEFLRNGVFIGRELSDLGRRNESVALKILNNKALCRTLDVFDLDYLGEPYPRIAQNILNNTLFVKKDLVLVASRHLKTAQEFLNDNNLIHSLDGSELALLGHFHLDVANEIMSNPALHAKLGRYSIFQLCLAHLPIAIQSMNDAEFRDTMHGIDLSMLGAAHQEIAQQIIEIPELCDRLDGRELSSLGKAHQEIAQQIIEIPELCDRLDGRDLSRLGKAHQEIAQQIIEIPELRDRLNRLELSMLGLAHREIAKKIFYDTSIRSKLDITQLCWLASKDLAIANQILNDKNLRAKLDGDCLVALSTHLEIFQRIFQDSTLFDKLDGQNLFDLFNSHPAKAEKLLESGAYKSKKSFKLYFLLYQQASSNSSTYTASEILFGRDTPKIAKVVEWLYSKKYLCKAVNNLDLIRSKVLQNEADSIPKPRGKRFFGLS